MKNSPKKAPILLLCFLLPAALMTAVFAGAGICPFGGKSLGVMDMPHQYISFLYSLRDILTGKASALYLPSMAMGGSMAGLGAYYLMGPVNLLTCLFPRERMYLAVSLVFLLRTGLCGLTAGIYCGERHGYGRRILLPALAYGLMAYMLSNSFNYMWQDSVVLLPVTALGAARLAEGRGWLLYTLSLAGALVCNFYIGYILCLFSVLFFLTELLSAKETRARSLRRTGAFALASLAAGALAAVVLLPAFLSLSGGKADFSFSGFTWTEKFPLRDLFVKFLPGAYRYEEIMPGGLPNLFCGTASLVLTALFFADRTIPARRRILTGCLFLFLVLSMWMTPLDLVWHGMNTPNWYNCRYSFLFSFLMAAAGDRALCRFREWLRPRDLLWPALTVLTVVLLALAGREHTLADWRSGASAIAAAAVTSVLLLFARPADAGAGRQALLGALLLTLHMAELGANGYISLRALTVRASDPDAWAAYVSEKAAAFDLLDTGKAYIRAESPDSFDMDRCEPMLFGYDGLSHYSSNVQGKNLDFLDGLGLDRYQAVYAIYGPGVTAGAESFLGVGRVVSQDMHKPYTALGSAGRYTVYKNPYALPVAFTVGDEMLRDAPSADCFERTQALYDAAAPEVGETIYTPAVLQTVTTAGFAADGDRYILTEEGLGSVTYTLIVQADGPLYGIMELPEFPTVTVFVNGAFCSAYATTQTNGSLYLGDFRAGDTVEVAFQTAADVTVERAAFVTEDLSALAAYEKAIAPGGCALTKLSNSHFTGSFTTGEGDSLLLLTMPYDPAWRILLDGADTQAAEVQGCLMAFPVTAGEHTLEMRYIPRGLIPGACISACGLVCTAAACGIRRKKETIFS